MRANRDSENLVADYLSRSLRITLLACLAACSDRQQASNTAITGSSPVHVTGVEGTYNGLMQLTSGPEIACGTSNIFTLTVRNNMFHYVLNQPQVPWQQQRQFTAMIGQDGKFYAQAGPAYIAGTVSQGHMQGQVVGDSCSFQFEADSDGTF